MGSSTSKNIIGIDLGTEYCCVATFKNNKVEIVQNLKGNKITPSYVALTENGWLVGEDAKEQAVENPINTVFDVKRLIGRRFEDPEVQVDIKSHWPFNVIIEDGKKPKIELIQKGKKSYFYPEEISAKLLSYMKEIAEIFLGGKVDYAVIAVPVNFNETQRQMTIDAAKIAGLEVLELVNEPTASFLAFSYEMFVEAKARNIEEHNVLVFDLGGGTLDVSLYEITYGQMRTIGSCGDTHLGGNDFNQRMVEYVLKLIKDENHIDLSNDKSVLHLLNILTGAA